MAAHPSAAPRSAVAGEGRHSLAYEPALDGVRAVAVLSVLGMHYGIPLVRGGGMGVDVFFVLSGYLITLVLQAPGGASLPRFYWRRITRLLPALALLCAADLAVGWALRAGHQAVDDVAMSLTYVSNWTRAFGLGSPQVLAHTWSLSVEEQFYLLFPPLFLALRRALPGRQVALVLVAVACACAGWRFLLAAGGTPEARYYNGLDTHCDGLLLGCALAVLRAEGLLERAGRLAGRADALLLAALVLLLALCSWTPTTCVVANLLCLGLLCGVSHPSGSGAARLLSRPTAVKVGQLSYSLYLWHYPVLTVLFYQFHMRRAAVIAIGIPLSFAAAALSHRFVERPVLRWRDCVGAPKARWLGASGLAGSAALIAAGGFAYLGGGVAAPPPRPDAQGAVASAGPGPVSR